jgi:hypothetical protein
MVRSVKVRCSSSLRTNTPIRAVTRELPYNYPFIVQKEYILAFVNKWGDPARALFISIAAKLKELTLRVVDTHFGNYTHGYLKQRVS